MTNFKFENARSTNIEYDEFISKKQKVVNTLLSSDSKNKIAYLEFCNYLMDTEEVGMLNLEELLLNAGIIFSYNYENIQKLENKENILNFLSLIDKNNQDCEAIRTSANYLLDDKVMKRLMQLSKMKNFEYFKEKLITTIVFRATHLKTEIDVLKLINDYLKYYKEIVKEFDGYCSECYVRARA